MIKIRIHLSLIFYFVMSFLLGHSREFFLIAFISVIYSLCGIFFSYIFGKPVRKICIDIIEKNTDRLKIKTLPLFKQIIIYTSGSLCLIFLSEMIKGSVFFKDSCLFIGIFNLLPIYPLNGGKLILSLFEKKWGKLNLYKLSCRILKISGAVLIIWGFIINILFPGNMFFIFYGMRLIKISPKIKKEVIHSICTDKKVLPENIIIMPSNSSYKDIIKRLKPFSNNIIICVKENKLIIFKEKSISFHNRKNEFLL